MNPIILLGGGVLVLLLLIVGVVVSITSERSLVEERLGRFLEDERPQPEGEAGSSIITEWLNRRVARSSIGDRTARELARADLKFKVAEYYALVFMATVVTGFLAWLLQPNIISAIIGAVIGFFIPRFYVKRQQTVRLNKFNDQLSDMLNLMVNVFLMSFTALCKKCKLASQWRRRWITSYVAFPVMIWIL